MKRTFLMFSFLTVALMLSAQDAADTVSFSQIQWESKTICKGITVRSAVTNLFNSCQAIYVADIDTSGMGFDFRVGVSRSRSKTSTRAENNNAIVAVNGTFFNMAECYDVHFIKVNDTVVATTKEKEFASRATGVFSVSGTFADILSWDINKEHSGAVWADDAMVSGPLMIDNGQDVPMFEGSFVTARHPRSMVGATAEGHILFVVVDGRQPGYAEGMNLYELRALARALGCTDAMNLDGGGSSTLWAKGEELSGVVNKPSGQVERTVTSILYVMKAE